MNALDCLSGEVSARLVITLVHFLWQATAVGGPGGRAGPHRNHPRRHPLDKLRAGAAGGGGQVMDGLAAG
jgi:hypothetical protein